MKKFFSIIFICVLAVGSLSSCNDWLDVQPQSQQREKDMFKSYEGFKSALVGCYSSMASATLYGERLTISDIEYLACLWNEPGKNTGVLWQHLYKHDYKNQPVEDDVKRIYSGLYNVIAQANMVIKHAETEGGVIADVKSRNVIMGEAYAIRAFCHFDVLRLFGQLPQNPKKKVMLPYSLGTGINYTAPYLDYEQFVAQLEKDLEQAERLLAGSDPIQEYNYDALNKMGDNPVTLDDEYMQFRQFRINYFAVRAIKARLYLYIGKLDKAYKEARYIIDAKVAGEPFMKLSGVKDISNRLYTLPNECIFALSNNRLDKYVPDLLQGYNGRVDGETNLVITNEMLNKVLYDGANTTSDNRYISIWNRMSADVTGHKYPSLLKYSYNINEYQRPAMLSKLMTKLQLMPLIRLSEMYLITMETTKDLSEANALYKTYMASHNVNVSKNFTSLDEVKAEVMKDYHREFYAEGVMFYTYKRTFTKRLLFTSKPMTEDNYILPLPITEANTNAKPVK